ncbi:MAG: MgtC/SapB family protein [Nitrospirae bacterium]|nr:MAG: MgtC/SapB family protein [Nitrospirota bacterium]
MEHCEIAFKLLLGAVLGGAIGFERQSHGRPAGFRTHLIVCVASVLIMVVSDRYYEISNLNPDIIRIDPARIAAGAITGIGFLGAGVILKSGFTVQGLTTAACLWIVSAIGLAVGSSLYWPALIAFSITLIALWGLRKVEAKISRLNYKILVITTEMEIPRELVLETFKQKAVSISDIDYEFDRPSSEVTYHIRFVYRNEEVINSLIEGLKEIKGLKRFYLKG